MVGQEALSRFIKEGLSAAGGDAAEIVAHTNLTRVVRFANSRIHQPMEERNVNLFVRILRNGKLGFASTNGMNREAFLAAIKKAKDNASLPSATPSSFNAFSLPMALPHTDGCIQGTANTGTESLEGRVEGLIARGEGTGVSFAGVFWTITSELAVQNSMGVNRYHAWTAANCQTVGTKGEMTGFSAQASPDLNAIHPDQIAEAAIHRATRFKESISLPPGEYECLFEEYAVADLLFYLAHMSFTADAVEEGRSIIGLRQGKKITDPSVTIWDDGGNPANFPIPFDVEGVPRKKVVFIREGMAEDVVTDLATAKRAKKESTGHALPMDMSEGPLPLHLEMAPGTSSKDDLQKQIKRGLLVTRFHYIREVHSLKTMVTGMTRDGVFLIENGEITGRVKNFRFTESIVRAFSNVKAISKERKLIAGEIDSGFPAGVIAPKVLVSRFTFTGNTKF